MVLACMSLGAPIDTVEANTDFCGDISTEFGAFVDCSSQVKSFSEFDGSLSLPDGALNPTLTQDDNIKDFVQRIVNFALGLLGFIAVVIVIYSGFQYVTALDNSEQLDKAKSNIKNMVIGIIIIFASGAIVNTALNIPTTGIDGSPSGEATNRAQLASYNSAATEVRDATVGFIRAYDQLLDNSRQLALIKTYEPSEFTSREDFIRYLNNVKDQLELISRDYDPVSSTRFAAAFAIDQAVIKSILVIQDQIGSESVEILDDQATNSNLFNFVRGIELGVEDFLNENIVGGDAKRSVLICALPVEERPVNFGEVDCNGEIRQVENNNLGSKITSDLREYINEIVYKRGIIADYQQAVDNVVNTLETLNNSANTDFVAIELENGSNLSQTIEDIIDVMSPGGSVYDIESALDPFANITIGDADAFGVGGVDENAFDNSRVVTEVINDLQFIYKGLVNVKFTAPVITTNVSRGSAPLVVTFDGSKSYDPAELSLNDENFEWDVLGDGDFQNPLKNPDLVVCEEVRSGPLNLASTTCTFKRPGSYRVALRLSSSGSAEQEILPGIAYKTIRVTPPNARIDLEVTPDGDSPIILQRYNDDDGTIALSRDEFDVTLKQAQAGLLFEADATGNKITNYTWRFSDDRGTTSGSGDTILDNSDDPETNIGSAQNDVKTIKKTFNERGRYSGILSVTDAQGNTDRKVFYINVNTIVARVTANKLVVQPGEELILDSSNSQSDSGPIVAREWTLDGEAGNLGSEEILTITFDEPGDKSVGLKVRDSEGNEETVQVKVLVESREPTAVIIANSLNKNKPSIVTFDASQSTDPDQGDIERLSYNWNIPGKLPEIDYRLIEGKLSGDKTEAEIVEVQFLKKGNYDIELIVTDPQGKQSTDSASVNVRNIIDLSFAEDQKYAIQLDENKLEEIKAETTFTVESLAAESATIFFGDGNRQTGRFNNGVINFEHEYKEAGAFDVRVEAELDGDTQSITETFLVGAGSSPISVITLKAYGNTYTKVEEMPAIYRDVIITFDASNSLNIDGSNDDLLYSWDTGDGGKFTQRTFTKAYRDLPAGPRGTFPITLTVTNLNDRSQTDTRTINLPVIQAFPTVKDLIVTPAGGPITPFDIEIEAVGANDPDGNIRKFIFYYYPLSASGERVGTVIANSPRARMQIGTLGEEGEQIEYGICVDLIDDDGNETKCQEIFNEGAAATVTVINGKNDPPSAKFRVDRTSINVGDSVNFIDESTDPDGRIVQRRFDFNGDGSFADEEVFEKSAVEHTFETVSPIDGFQVRMEVVDDKGGRSVSSSVPIFVDSNLEPPTAAFRVERIADGVQFKNNSRADVDNGGFIARSVWDFDVQLDSDGDGNTANDIDSEEFEPTFDYGRSGLYGARLTVFDNEGNSDDIQNSFTLSILGETVSEVAMNTSGTDGGLSVGTDKLGFPTLQPGGRPTDNSGGDVSSQPIDSLFVDGEEVDAFPSAPENDELANNKLISSLPAVDTSVDAILSEDGEFDVTFLFSQLPSNVAKVEVDKNTYLDSNSGTLGSTPDGVRNNDVDFVTEQLVDYTTSYSSAFSPTRTKVTVTTTDGEEFTDYVDIKFVGLDFNASLSLDVGENIPIISYLIILSLISIFSGIMFRNVNLGTKGKTKLK